MVAESMREILEQEPIRSAAGVFSDSVMSFLSLYRDPIVAANTEYSEFKINDLVNHERRSRSIWWYRWQAATV